MFGPFAKVDVKLLACDSGSGEGSGFIGNVSGIRLGTAVAKVGPCSLTLLPRCVAEGGQVPLLPAYPTAAKSLQASPVACKTRGPHSSDTSNYSTESSHYRKSF